MPCNSPNRVFYTGINPETGKKLIFYTSRFVDYIWRRDPESPWQTARLPESQTQLHGTKNEAVYRNALNKLVAPPGGQLIIDSDLVPCGQCIGCRLDYCRQWATRCMLEAKDYPKGSCWFVTFTYDDEHLPEYGRDVKVNNYYLTRDVNNKEHRVKIDESKPFQYWKHIDDELVNPITGEIKHPPLRSVSKKTHELLMKRIRKRYGDGIRFFMSGEYGDKSFRPHYHYLLFGIQFNDLVFYKRNWRGDLFYNSPSFERATWTDDKGDRLGYVVLSPLSFDNANYVARYTLKKAKMIQKDEYKKLGIEPEFCLMSRKPGIGKEYFEDNYEYIYQTDEIILPGHDGAITVKPPSYYDTLYDKLDSESMDSVKDKRRCISDDAAYNLAYRNPGLDLEDVYESANRRLQNKVIFKKKGEL